MARGYVKARGLDILAIFENYKKPGQAPYGHVLARSFWRVPGKKGMAWNGWG